MYHHFTFQVKDTIQASNIHKKVEKEHFLLSNVSTDEEYKVGFQLIILISYSQVNPHHILISVTECPCKVSIWRLGN